MKKINKEFSDLMLTKTEGRMISQLTVSASSLATEFMLGHRTLQGFVQTGVP